MASVFLGNGQGLDHGLADLPSPAAWSHATLLAPSFAYYFRAPGALGLLRGTLLA